MAQADGTVYINTEIETDGFKAGGKEIEAACRRMSQQVNNIGKTAKLALQKQTDAFVKQNQLYAQQERKVQSLKAKLKELENQQMPTDEFAEIGKQIDNDTVKLNRLLKSQEDFLATGGRVNSSAYKKRQMQIEELQNSIRYAKDEQDDLLSSGKAYKTPETRETKQKLASEEEKLMQMHNKLGTSYEDLKNKVESYAKSSKKLINVSKILNGISNSLSSGFKKIAFYIKKAASSMLDMNKNTKRTRMTLGRMLGMSLLFSTVFRALSTITNGIKEGFQNLAQYSGSTNASISSLMSALTQLKNSFATAFSPILSVVAPILTSFINMLSKAITYVGMFFAALTGAKSFTKAKAVQQDYAAGLGDTASAAGNAADAQKDLNDATDDYLTGLDEIHKFESKKDTSGAGSGGGGGGGGISIGDMFEEVPINSTISGLADKIKDAIRREDWKGLGKMIADGINAGMKKVYNALNWKKVGKKITKFVDAFTDTFNSLVDHIDWDLMGRTIGTGINTLVKTLNRLIERIDWKNLGRKFAKGVNGLLNEVNWRELGNLIGNKFMIAWNIFSGFVEDLDWAKLGVSIAEGLNGIFEKIDFETIAHTLVTGINGAFEALKNFTTTFSWRETAQNIGNGISNFLTGINWKENGQALGQFITDLCGAIREVMTAQNFYAIGNGIGTFLSQLPWGDMLYTAGVTLVNAFGGVLSGLASTPAGAFVAAFIVIIKGNELIDKLAGAFKTLFNTTISKGASDAAETIGSSAGILKLKKALGIITAGWFAAEATMVKLSSSDVTKSVSESADTVADALDKIASQSQLTEDQVGNLKTMLENAAESNENTLSTYSNLAIELHNMGVKSEDVRTILEDLGVTVSDDAIVIANRMKDIEDGVWRVDDTVSSASDSIKQSNDEIAQSATDTMNSVRNSNSQIGQSASDAASRIDEAKGLWIKGLDGWKQVTGDKAIEIYNAIQNGLYYQNSEGYYVSGSGAMISFGEGISSEIGNIQTTAGEIGESVAKSTSASYSTKLNALKQPTSVITKSFVDEGVKSPAESELGISGNKSSVFEGYGETVSKSLSKGADSQKSTVWNKMSDILKGVTGSFSGISSDMESKGKSAITGLDGGIRNNSKVVVNQMQALSNQMKAVFSNISETYKKFGADLPKGMAQGISSPNSINIITNAIQRIIANIQSMGSYMYTAGRNLAQQLAYGIQSVHIPVPTVMISGYSNYAVGTSRVSMPRFKVSYLASGAVIPPNKEFMAVLGDQKHGTNIETPEALLRKIVREESGKNKNNGRKYTFIGQINRRTLFEEVIEEAKLRQMMSGNNPFELG